MKKSILLVVVLLIIIFVSATSFAFHVIGEDMRTKLSLRYDYVSPEDSDSFVELRAESYFQKGDLGFGGEVKLTPEFDYLRFRPYATLNVGPITPIVGFSTDSNGVDHVDAGVWYFRQLSDDFSIFVDLRNFWGLNDDSTDFTDDFVAIGWNINDKFFTGLDLAYDHWWESRNDWYMVGIPLGYNWTDRITSVVRPTFDSFIPEGADNTDDAFSVKAAVSIKF